MSSKVAYGTVETRSTTDDQQRANAREKVASGARRGEDPRSHHAAEDLSWAFAAGHESELDELERLAAEVRDQRDERERGREQARELLAMTDAILAEQDAERRSKAEAEARERLGISDA